MDNGMALYDDPRMTIKQVAEALGVDSETIRVWIRKLYPGLMRNGLATYLDEEQVTNIKQHIGTGRNDLQNILKVKGATTDLEMKQKAAEVMAWLMAENARKDEALAIAAPKVESFNALMRSDQTMSITDAAKHFGIHPKAEVFPYLRERGYLTAADLPTQAAIDAGYLALREVERRGDGKIIKQACVLACQLETWRTRVVPQIAAWKVKGIE